MSNCADGICVDCACQRTKLDQTTTVLLKKYLGLFINVYFRIFYFYMGCFWQNKKLLKQYHSWDKKFQTAYVVPFRQTPIRTLAYWSNGRDVIVIGGYICHMTNGFGSLAVLCMISCNYSETGPRATFLATTQVYPWSAKLWPIQ